ncbi:uncharacterized protein [Hemitrygon akajei]|uniref:uncharacterized protein n=1 Tax=Hemitrygon akajei TaxID=2704970 RepID=UPI003BF954B8
MLKHQLADRCLFGPKKLTQFPKLRSIYPEHVLFSEETVSGVAVVTNNSTPLENLDTIALSCDASGTVETRTWFKDDQPIRENGRIIASFDNSKLTIISVNGNDAGTYKCIASNSFSSGAGETDVQVYCGCTAPETGDNFTLGAGAIVGIVLGSLAGGLIGGVCAWLFARKIGGIKDPPQSQYDTSIDSGRNSTLDTNTVNASGTYENFSRKEQGARNNAEDENSTYTGLVLGDRSVYGDLKRLTSNQFSETGKEELRSWPNTGGGGHVKL